MIHSGVVECQRVRGQGLSHIPLTQLGQKAIWALRASLLARRSTTLIKTAMGSDTKYPSLDGSGGRVIPKFSKRNTILDTCKAAGIGALFGLNMLLVRNSLSPSRSVTGGLRGHTGMVTSLALVGGAYALGDAVAANLNERETLYNGACGGALAGAVLGAQLKNFGRRSVAKSVGGAALLSFVVVTFQWGFDRGHRESVNAVTSSKTELNDNHPKQGFWELVHRRPLSQTVEELGDLAKQFVRE